VKILSSEWIKTKRTHIRWLTFLAPVIFAALVIGYYSIREISTDIQTSIFQVFFEVWAAMVIPLGAGLISGLMIHQEELAGSFNSFLGSKLPRYYLYLGKLAILALSSTVSILIATLSLVVGFNAILKISIAWPVFIAAAIMAIIGTIPLLTFHLWISFAWGMGASIGIGGAGLLIAALMGTSLGDKVWQFVPWAWPVRLSMLPGAYLLYKPGMDYSPEIISSGFVINQAIIGLVPVAVFFAVMLFGGLVWFKRWEGEKLMNKKTSE
jgi:ABC-2 type transport system permease protein